jgi:hypothetical protein
MCERLVRKLTMGEPLDNAEKSHLAECESCMAEVVRILDRSSATEPNGLGVAPGCTNGELNHARPEAKKAIEQGRRVFERGFGISLPEDRKSGR